MFSGESLNENLLSLLFQTNYLKWDHFEILATGRSDIHCRIKESLLIKDLKPSLNENVGSEKRFFTSLLYIFQQTLIGLFFISFSPLY